MTFSKTFLFLSIICTLFASCTKHSSIIEKMQNIKDMSNYNLDSALGQFDSLEIDVDKCSDEVRNMYELLSIRLADKTYVTPKSDAQILRLVKYYEKHGDFSQRQEAYYYAGSVYRDLDDTPQALVYFLKSINCMEDNASPDSVLLRNAYSQLYLLYFNVQDYRNAAKMASKEKEIATKLGILNLCTKIHECVSLLHIDSITPAKEKLKLALLDVVKDSTQKYTQGTLSSLLYHLSYYELREEATKCNEMLRHCVDSSAFNDDTYFALAEYFKLCSQQDSAIHCYEKVLANSIDLNSKYDASKSLAYIYLRRENNEMLRKYAYMFMNINDSLNLGKRQSLAATTNNKYKYQLTKEKEERLNKEKENYRTFTRLLVLITIIIVLLSAIIISNIKNRRLREMLEKIHEINLVKDDNKKLQLELEQQQYQLCTTKEKLTNNTSELEATKAKLEISDKELQDAKNQLEFRLEQSKGLIQLLHKTQFEEGREDILKKMQLAAQGRYQLKESDWKIFSNAVCQLYPSLNSTIIQQLGKKVSNEQLQFCYMLRIGLTNPEIERITNLSRATVWRWSKKFEWILDS